MQRCGRHGVIDRIVCYRRPVAVVGGRFEQFAVHVIGNLERRPLAADHDPVVDIALKFRIVVPALELISKIHMQIVVELQTVLALRRYLARVVILENVDLQPVHERIGIDAPVHPERRPPAVLARELHLGLEISVDEFPLRTKRSRLKFFAVFAVIGLDLQNTLAVNPRMLAENSAAVAPAMIPVLPVDRIAFEFVGENERPSLLNRIESLSRLDDAGNINLLCRCGQSYKVLVNRNFSFFALLLACKCRTDAERPVTVTVFP